MERSGRVMRYYCVDATVDTRAIRSSFREMVAPLLSDSRFYLCGASFVLNFQHVRGVNGQTALLDNGKAVPLPLSLIHISDSEQVVSVTSVWPTTCSRTVS